MSICVTEMFLAMKQIDVVITVDLDLYVLGNIVKMKLKIAL